MRGFTDAEYHNRLARAQKLMADMHLDGLLLTIEAEIRYFTGFLTRFWESPARPWFLIVPQSGMPVAVIPSIGEALMSKMWIEDIRCWSSPNLYDDGISLLADTISERLGTGAVIGTPSGPESHLRMPLEILAKVKAACRPAMIDGDADIIRQLRMVKSDAEIDKIRTACNIAGRAFGRVSEIASCGTPFSTVFRGFQQLCLEEGADWVPYVAGGTGPLGYDDVISPATDAPLQDGHIFMLDTGLVYDGYFCDFDRNYVVGRPDQEVVSGWGRLLEATEAGKQAVRPGACAHDICHAMNRILSGGKGVNSAGRLGHGLGMQLTEWPSFMAGDASELKQGMVITLEPTLAMSDGTVLVHEDNFVITRDGLEQLSPQAPEHLWSV